MTIVNLKLFCIEFSSNLSVANELKESTTMSSKLLKLVAAKNNGDKDH